MTDYQFETQLVADPVTFQRAATAKVTVYDIADTSNSAPLALKDLNGLPLPNPLTSTADAFIPPFVASSPLVKLVGGTLTVPAFSPKPLSDQAKAAQDAAAASAASAAQAASYAAGLLAGPLDGGNASTQFTGSFNFDGGNANG
ncbi:hypothetical protein [Sinomonas gamaensis]|uniref:hypothetical protein n=1 Tax=Sinomonas gamaensis TaxID=2565624 RepID=UPI001109C6C7|nr:hypothetical protein [Sinomonas gamaensis]